MLAAWRPACPSRDLDGVKKLMKLNEGKTQMLLMSRRRRAHELDEVDVRVQGQKVARSKKVKCLGVWIDDSLTWGDHVEAYSEKEMFCWTC